MCRCPGRSNLAKSVSKNSGSAIEEERDFWEMKKQMNLTKYSLSIYFGIFVSAKESTYKLNLLGHLDLFDNTTSDVVCKGASVTDAEGVRT